jgi:hypothetical protein
MTMDGSLGLLPSLPLNPVSPGEEHVSRMPDTPLRRYLFRLLEHKHNPVFSEDFYTAMFGAVRRLNLKPKIHGRMIDLIERVALGPDDLPPRPQLAEMLRGADFYWFGQIVNERPSSNFLTLLREFARLTGRLDSDAILRLKLAVGAHQAALQQGEPPAVRASAVLHALQGALLVGSLYGAYTEDKNTGKYLYIERPARVSWRRARRLTKRAAAGGRALAVRLMRPIRRRMKVAGLSVGAE